MALNCRQIELPLSLIYSLQNRRVVLNLSTLHTLEDVQTYKLTVTLISKGDRQY